MAGRYLLPAKSRVYSLEVIIASPTPWKSELWALESACQASEAGMLQSVTIIDEIGQILIDLSLRVHA